MKLSTSIGDIEATEADFIKLLALSPMIEVQFKNIILERALVEAHHRISQLEPKGEEHA